MTAEEALDEKQRKATDSEREGMGMGGRYFCFRYFFFRPTSPRTPPPLPVIPETAAAALARVSLRLKKKRKKPSVVALG